MSSSPLYPLVTFIIPFLNSSSTILAALTSIEKQTYKGPLEVSAFDDGSTDGSADIIRAWAATRIHIPVIIGSGVSLGASGPRGPGFARNRAAAVAKGEYLCFLDADDEALPMRVELQLKAALETTSNDALIGGRFIRDPPDATPKYAAWANSMTAAELLTHSWRECTLIQPTWFISRSRFQSLGGYDEVPPNLVYPFLESASSTTTTSLIRGGNRGSSNSLLYESSFRLGAVSTFDEAALDNALPQIIPVDGESLTKRHLPLITRAPLKLTQEGLSSLLPFATFPEDPIFFHRHLYYGGKGTSSGRLVRVDEPVITYRYSPTSLSWRVPRSILCATRAAIFEEVILAPRGGNANNKLGLHGVAIWGAGRDGKDFYNALSPFGRSRIDLFFDIDSNKIGNVYPIPVNEKRLIKKKKRLREEGGAGAGAEVLKEAEASSSATGSAITSTASTATSSATAEVEAVIATPRSLPIKHFSSANAATRAILVCVALDTGGEALRNNVRAAVLAIVKAGGEELIEGKTLFFMC